MPSDTSASTAYVAHFGFDRRTSMVLIGCVVFVAVLIWMPADSGVAWLIKVAGLLLFGLCGLLLAVMAARGGIALSADGDGVTLGNPRMPQVGHTKEPVNVPWRDLAEVVLFDQRIVARGFTHRMPYVGFRLRSGAWTAATSFDPDSRLWKISRDLLPHVPEEVLLRSRPVNGWRLDERRLCDAVARFAPDVRVVRLDEAGEPHPVCPG
jgi:hypothetical protein